VGFNVRIGADLADRGGAGADAVLVMPPTTRRRIRKVCLEYYRHIAEPPRWASCRTLAIAAAFTPELIEQLARRVPNLIAFKDGRGGRAPVSTPARARRSSGWAPSGYCWLAGVGDDWWRRISRPALRASPLRWRASGQRASVELYRLASSEDFAGLRRYHERVCGRSTSSDSVGAGSKCRS